ncbi:MAG: class I SAM-dependent methyltransferase [Thermovirgaceae bacterium]|mgnify:CR=1 FL=1|nr:class I SAM-dependent methyltransferase [Synergistales bacterium]HPC75947.1 class I SAM-dependent methyltransferase [Synergistales bacterium]HRS48666.1 class I SAM-dependent methyltransferase [Thermovirgaceae bacterium]HRU91038.1 class I SAM-dependent methyltransferase [Thermovirgaceae bacterium]
MSVFDDHAKSYDEWYTTPIGKWIDEIETRCAFGLLEPRSGMKILDAGCGTGNFSLKLARLGCAVTGVDLSGEMLAIAIEKAEAESLEVKFLSMDIKTLEFDDGAFDAVVSMAALEFIQNPLDAAEEMFRVVRKGGRLVIGTINRLSPWGELYMEIGRRSDSVYRHARFLSLEEMSRFRPENLASTKECLFFRPENYVDNSHPGEDHGPAEPGRGGFLCAMWMK